MNQLMTAPIKNNPIVQAPPRATRWGFWATHGFSVIIIAASTIAQGFVIGLMVGIQTGIGTEFNQEELVESIVTNGFYLSVGTIASAWVGALVIGAAVLLRKGISLKEYLALKSVPFKAYAFWSVIVLIYLLAWQGVSMVWEPPDSEWMTETYQTAEYLPLFWIALVVAAR